MKRIGKGLSRIASSVLHWIAKPFVWLWYKYFVNEWHVTIWYDPTKKSIYEFKSISIIEPTHLQGKLTSGEPFELKTQEPFNYQIKKVK